MLPFDERIGAQEWREILWKGKHWILFCAFLGAIIGIVTIILVPKTYEARVTARSIGTSSLAPLSEILSGSPGVWYAPGNIDTSVQEIFLRFARDRNNLRAYIFSHRNLVPNVKVDDLASNRSSFDIVLLKDSPVNGGIEFRFRYPGGDSGAQVLNDFVKSVIDETSARLLSDSKTTLNARKESREREVARLRARRDLVAKQDMFVYQGALQTAKSADIDTPLVANLGNVYANSGQQPLAFFGTRILGTELKNISERIGNDLAIPDFANLKSEIDDCDAKYRALDQLRLIPFLVTESAFETDPVFPPRTPIVLICIAIGTMIGIYWAYIRFWDKRRSL